RHADDQGRGESKIAELAVLPSDAVRQEKQEPIADRRARDEQRIARLRLHPVVDQQADDAGRNGGQGDAQRQPAGRVVAVRRARLAGEEADHQVAHVQPEVEKGGDQGAGVGGDDEVESLIFPTEEVGDEDQMRGGADRDELGDPLDHGEQHGMPGIHERRLVDMRAILCPICGPASGILPPPWKPSSSPAAPDSSAATSSAWLSPRRTAGWSFWTSSPMREVWRACRTSSPTRASSSCRRTSPTARPCAGSSPSTGPPRWSTSPPRVTSTARSRTPAPSSRPTSSAPSSLSRRRATI